MSSWVRAGAVIAVIGLAIIVPGDVGRVPCEARPAANGRSGQSRRPGRRARGSTTDASSHGAASRGDGRGGLREGEK
jgi:hypothetical protein